MPTVDREIQELAARLVKNEVLCCVSSLVATLAAGMGHVGPSSALRRADGVALGDLVTQASDLASPIPDYEEAARQAGWILWHHADNGPLWHNIADDGADDTYKSAQDLCEAEGIEPYDWQVYEHWAISSRLGEDLAAVGEKVDTDFAGLVVWARTSTGQSIEIDGAMLQVAKRVRDRVAADWSTVEA